MQPNCWFVRPQIHIKISSTLSRGVCHTTSLMISQHWFTSWLGAVKQQTITWTNVDHVLCCYCFTKPLWNKISLIKLVLISVMFNRPMMRKLHFRFFLTNKDHDPFRRGINISHNRLDVVTLMTVTSLLIAPAQRVHLWDGEGWVLFTAVTIDQTGTWIIISPEPTPFKITVFWFELGGSTTYGLNSDPFKVTIDICLIMVILLSLSTFVCTLVRANGVAMLCSFRCKIQSVFNPVSFGTARAQLISGKFCASDSDTNTWSENLSPRTIVMGD